MIRLPRGYFARKSRELHADPEHLKMALANWDHPPQDATAFWIRLQIPFDYACSKNQFWRYGNGHFHLTAEAKAIKKQLQEGIFQALHPEAFTKQSGVETCPLPWDLAGFYRNKVWLDFQVEKPDHRGDALNVLDLIADAIKEAIAIDDRWFSVHRLDWRVNKMRPLLTVTVLQDARWHGKVCAACGLVLAEDRFSPKGTTCKVCLKTQRKKNA